MLEEDTVEKRQRLIKLFPNHFFAFALVEFVPCVHAGG